MSALAAEERAAIVGGRHGDPFAVLGPHDLGDGRFAIRAFRPDAASIEAIDPENDRVLASLVDLGSGFFEAMVEAASTPAYRLRAVANDGGASWTFDDPYAFGPLLGAIDEWLFAEGAHKRLYDQMGAREEEALDLTGRPIAGARFAVWAPNAQRCSLVGDFNGWNPMVHPMRKRAPSGVFELFLPAVRAGDRYKFALTDASGETLPLKADPFGRAAEKRPDTASLVVGPSRHQWRDAAWLERRATADHLRAPMAIYEVHLGSWRRRPDGSFLSWDELAEQLIAYASDMRFTHIQLLPVSEHPFDGSWGYQPLGLFAPTARHGEPDGLKRLVDSAHAVGIGVLADWVPGHFPTDQHGLGRFDGTCLYEHEDPRQGYHLDWNTLIYNYGRKEVVNYLSANALYWLEAFHLDGLRVDAVASMLYLDYSRPEGGWVPNPHGGNENLDAIAFLKRVNELAYGDFPGVVTIAEESTAWPGVTKPTWAGGLGFGLKWNMGWMNDTLDYMKRDPIHRRYHHHQMTFGLLYGFSENFVLPLSHDEVVHGKGSILGRMPGDAWSQFANLRAYYGFMWGHPGKKLLFMGQEFAQGAEWSEDGPLPWELLDIHWHRGARDLVRDLNRLHVELGALHKKDADAEGFRWVDANDAERSIYAWLRFGDDDDPPVLVVSNMTPVPREGLRLGAPRGGYWREILNTDSALFGGSDMGNGGGVEAEARPHHGFDHSVTITAPPLATLYFVAS